MLLAGKELSHLSCAKPDRSNPDEVKEEFVLPLDLLIMITPTRPSCSHSKIFFGRVVFRLFRTTFTCSSDRLNVRTIRSGDLVGKVSVFVSQIICLTV